MAVSYKKLWKLLIDHDMKKKDLAKVADISNYTITKMSKVDKEDYLLAMERSHIKDIEIKHVLKAALTDRINAARSI